MEEFQIVKRDQLSESINPRHHYDIQKFRELVESIRHKGILEPLLVRPFGGKFQIVCGSRRFKAAQEAKVNEIPVRVKEMTDQEVLETQTIENLHREDLHPLDEAEGYQKMIGWGYDVPGIAKKIGKSDSYVYQRLKLASLTREVQKAFLEDKITAGHAILIARLQPKNQKEALEACFNRYGEKELGGVRQLASWIDSNIHLDLHAARFNKKDEMLVPEAGTCTDCPKRTGFVPALFPDIKKKDTCTDPQCFNAKMDAHVQKKIQELKEDTDSVLLLSDEYDNYGREKTKEPVVYRKDYHEISSKEKPCEFVQKGIITEGRERGKVLTVCANKECKKHFSRGSFREPVSEEEKARKKAEQQKAKAEKVFRNKLLDAILAKISSKFEKEDLELICKHFSNYQILQELCPRHGIEPKKLQYGKDYEGPFHKYVVGLDLPGLHRLLMEIVLVPLVANKRWSGEEDELITTAKRHGIDVKAIEKEVTELLKPKKKGKVQTSAKSKKKEK